MSEEQFQLYEAAITADTGEEKEITLPSPAVSDEYANLFGSLAAIGSTAFIPGDMSFGDKFLQQAEILSTQIQQGLEGEIRESLARQNQLNIIEGISGALSAELGAGTSADLDLINSLVELDVLKREQLNLDALEREALDRIDNIALMHQTNQGVAELLLEHEVRGDAFEVMRDKLERRIIMQREAAKIGESYSNSSFVGKLVDYLGLFAPAAMLTATDNLPGGIEGVMNATGSSLLEVQNQLMNMPREEFNEVYPKLYKAIREESGYIGENFVVGSSVANQLLSINTRSASFLNGLDFFDILSLPVGSFTVRAIGKLGKASILRRAKARELATQVTVTSIDDAAEATPKAAKEVDSATAMDEAMPSAVKTTEEDILGGEVSISAAVTSELKLQDEIIKRIAAEADDIGRVSDEVMERIEIEAAEAIKNELGNVVDFKIIPGKANTLTASVLLGRKGGIGGFATEAAAKGSATKHGILDYIIGQGTDGQFYIRTRFGISEGKFLEINPNKVNQSGPWSTFLRSSAALQDEFLHNRAVQAGMKASRFRALMKPMFEPIKMINRKSRKAVAAVWERGNTSQKWYTSTEFAAHFKTLNGRLPTEGETLAYFSLKNINDADHFFLNHDLYTTKFNQGWVTGAIELPNFKLPLSNVKKLEQVGEVEHMVIYDAIKGEVIEGRVVGSQALRDRIKAGDEFFKLDEVIDHADGPIGFVIGKKGTMKTGPLRYQQLNYTAGGHRLYEGKYFVKMASVQTLKSGRTVIMNPKTFAVAKTRAEAAEWADKWNETLDAYRIYAKDVNNLDNLRAFETTLARHGFDESVEDFTELVKKQKLEDPKHRFEVAFDKEEPSVYASLRKEGNIYDQTSAIKPHESWYQTSGRMYYSRKGKPLKGPQEERASFVDPYKTAQMAIENNIHKAAFTNFRVTAINNWMEAFGSYLQKNGKSAEANFFGSEKLKGGDQLVLQRAEQMRTLIKRQIGTKTAAQEGMEIGVRRFAEWIEKPSKALVGDKSLTIGKIKLDRTTPAKAVFNIGSRDPVTALKSLAFDLKLGLLEPSQLVIQTQTAAAMAFVDPVGFTKFARDLTPIRWALANGTDEVGAVLGRMTSMDKAEFKGFMKLLNESGAMNIGSEMVYFEKAALEPIAGGKAAIHKARMWGRWPFYEAEKINRIAAFRIAWNKMRKDISLEDMATTDNRAKLAGMTDKFSMNMMQASSAGWQKGAISGTTQFLSYQLRFLENILPFIGSKQWTSREKIGLAASQIALYGTAGVPMGQWLLSRIMATDPEAVDLAEDNSTAFRFATGGLIDGLIFALSGGTADVAASDRVAIAKGLEDTVAKLFGADAQETSFLEILGGAPVSIGLEVGSDIIAAFNMIQVAAHSERVALTDVTTDIFKEIADNAAIFSRGAKMLYALKYQQYVSSRTGKVLAGNVTTPEAFFIGLGLQPREMRDLGEGMDLLKARRELIKGLADPIAKLRRQSFAAYRQGDIEEVNRLHNLIAAHLAMMDESDRGEVSKRAMGRAEILSTTEDIKHKMFKQGIGFPNIEGN